VTKSEYRLYTSSEAWLERRKLFLSTHGICNRCQIDRDLAVAAYDQDLNVHHRNYQHIGCELDEDLEALCRRCHEIESTGKSDLHPANPEAIQVRRYIGKELPAKTEMTEDGLDGLFGGRA